MERKIVLTILCILAVVIASVGVQAAVVQPLVGDVNFDGKVNSSDVIILARHVANWKGYETLPFGAPASTEPTFDIEKVNAHAGEENVKVRISLKNNPGVASLRLKLQYDDTVATLTGIEYNTSIGGQPQLPQTYTSPVTLLWINYSSDVEEDFDFVTLNFNVKDGAAVGSECKIELSYNPDEVYNLEEENVEFDIQNGSIKIN